MEQDLCNMRALIYAEEDKDYDSTVKLLLQLGYLCKYETDISQLKTHIDLYSPSLIYAADYSRSELETSLAQLCNLYTSKRALLRKLSLKTLSLDDQQWHELLCSISLHSLSIFLWYICDADLLKSILSRFTLRTAQQLMEDLENNYAYLLHSSADQEILTEAEAAAFDILSQCQKIKQSSQGRVNNGN